MPTFTTDHQPAMSLSAPSLTTANVVGSDGSARLTGPEEISTERLLLRLPVYDDGVALHEALGDPLTCSFLPHRPMRNLHHTRDLLAGACPRRDAGLHSYVIAPKTRTAAGIGIVQMGPDGEIGAVMVRTSWRNGFVTEALGAMLETLGARHAWCICDADHEAVARALARISIVPEACLLAHRVHPQSSDRPRDCLKFRGTGHLVRL
ncbi:GNAT family N-acetyltransferase [Lichenibacterium ramalinae]|uniref:N-acetyltransferase n=1 Tax=Lichenibacterium ramalinae TaxID=2316527 RepID=A0A4Q2R4Y3_9HYPH|nr:GNAT family N-acetyltransferase [Lichenibacterium ramalinae]RYB01606.1 N-acetyltransferase [Lichenibacterium ramalinae]